MINKENKESNFEIISAGEFRMSDCGANEKKTCVILVENPSFS